MNIKCPYCLYTIENVEKLLKEEKKIKALKDIDNVIIDFDTNYRMRHGEYPNRNRLIKYLVSKGFNYRIIGKYYMISHERVRQIAHDLYTCDSCFKLVKKGDKSTHKPHCKRYKKI